jgi:hypothetical protein
MAALPRKEFLLFKLPPRATPLPDNANRFGCFVLRASETPLHVANRAEPRTMMASRRSAERSRGVRPRQRTKPHEKSGLVGATLPRLAAHRAERIGKIGAVRRCDAAVRHAERQK